MKQHLSRACALLAFASSLLSLRAGAQQAGANEWTWMGGTNSLPADFAVAPGVYGTRGQAAPGNMPGGREYAASWTDKNGHLWLFGGLVLTTQLSYFNDLWEYDPLTGEWAWMAGNNTVGTNCPAVSGLANCGQPGVYGTMGTPAAGNSPGGRFEEETWTDDNGNLWLYGGQGFDAKGNMVALSDLWEFSTSANEWAWMGGLSTVPLFTGCGACLSGQLPVPGTMGTAAAGNTPGGLWSAASWTDNSGNFWLFGGWGYAPSGYAGLPNDLWEFIPSSDEWGWMGGNADFGSLTFPPGIYGTLGTPAPGNVPGTRWDESTWTDANGNLWLFGGQGNDSTGHEGILNDLWVYDPATTEWTWMGGSSTLDCSSLPQEYCHEPGDYGTLGKPEALNIPGSRYRSAFWKDIDGNFWLFGGAGFDANGTWNDLNDLWEYNPKTNEWTWMGGPRVNGGTTSYGIYGTLGTPASINIPGSRDSAASWTDKDGNFWMWGGFGIDENGIVGSLNDLWRYQPTSTLTTTATPVFSPQGGTFTTNQAVTISDSTAGATIYFTTDGTTPTNKSPVYTGPIIVTASETVQAMATAANDLNSAVASATYTIPADFALAIAPTSVLVVSGGSGTTTLVVTDAGGFNANVTFACSGLPAGAACSFALAPVPTTPGITYTTLTVTTAAMSEAIPRSRTPLIPASMVTAGLLCLGWKKRRLPILLLAICLAAVGGMSGCANYHVGAGTSTSTVTVTGAAGALSHSTTFTLTVN